MKFLQFFLRDEPADGYDPVVDDNGRGKHHPVTVSLFGQSIEFQYLYTAGNKYSDQEPANDALCILQARYIL